MSRRSAVALTGLLVATSVVPGSLDAALAHKPKPHGVHVPAPLTRRQCSPAVSPCHLYVPVAVRGGTITVDCGHVGVLCDDEGA